MRSDGLQPSCLYITGLMSCSVTLPDLGTKHTSKAKIISYKNNKAYLKSLLFISVRTRLFIIDTPKNWNQAGCHTLVCFFLSVTARAHLFRDDATK